MRTKQMVLGGFFIALGVLLPIIFHMVHMGGPVFLPMHIPVLLAGFFLGGDFGFLVGLVTPFISSILTGMPVLMPMALIMTVELSLYGFLSGFLFHKFKLNSIISLIISMIIGRGGTFLMVYFMSTFFGFKKLNPILFIKGGLITGLPGIIIQIICIPILVHILNKSLNKNLSLQPR